MKPTNRSDQNNQASIFSLAIEFNLFPVRYMHRSWLEQDLHHKLISILKTNRATHYNLSNHLLNRFKLHNQFDFDFEKIEKRVVFANPKELSRLALYLGIVLNEDIIRSEVVRKKRVALEECLGKEAYQFAVKKAQFISRSSKQMGPSFLIDWNQLDRLKQYLTISGVQVIGCALSGTSIALRKRLSLKMPKPWNKALSRTTEITLDRSQCSVLMIKTHREVNRQWQHLFS